MAREVPPVGIVVLGRKHVGKTSLITALCGLKQHLECASSSVEPVLYPYPKNKAIVFWEFPPFGSDDVSNDASTANVKGIKLDTDLYECALLVCDDELAELDKSMLEQVLKLKFKKVVIVRNKVNASIEFDLTRCLENHSPDHVFSQCINGTEEYFEAYKPDKIFVLDTFDTDKFQFNDLDIYLQSGAGFNRANPDRSLRQKKSGGKRRISYLGDDMYQPAKRDDVFSVEQPAMLTGADGRACRTIEDTEGNDATRYDAGTSLDFSRWKDDISDLTADEDELKSFILDFNQSSPSKRRDLIRRTRDDLARWETETLNIAVTGNAGVGKSSFINAIRDVKPNEDGWARVDVVEGTMHPTQYNHPVFPNIFLWDLPGVGTERFRRDTYMDQVEFERYDFYIIVCAGRFTENDLWLAETIRQKEKTFFFVRTKVQQDIDNARRVYSGPPVFDENFVLRKIRWNCLDSLPTSRRGEVFLIDNYEPHLYDFGKLAMAIIQHSPPEKRQVATFGTCLLTEDVIKAKEEELNKRILKTALMVAVTDVSPIDVFGISSTDEYLLTEAHFYREQFKLTDAHLKKYAADEGKTKQELVECMQLKSTILCQSAKIPMVIEMLCPSKIKDIVLPVVTTLASGAVSFGIAIKFLSVALNAAVEDARKIRSIKSDNV
ncbi:interferon-inducible GTPase 5-like isoform X2 [Dreissena polymorpha]|uniref:IRG-type G domain-containing protein n=1 Tax=Dreissena polymorpha TaxID=45954 RepID=A0A9D4HQ76_DREPO|nr:interferon-inducible GTPase 5-like isoform X1 [Dreissena polymorpha]XP_052243119.1 interferon-inducible GTPase 5-like isoform X2 [Dreissena polymorpha]KAH3727464.1 hypothetical protein DPMN_053400 [Dreissena polymorpha]